MKVALKVASTTVAPYVGAWIETEYGNAQPIAPVVAPYVGAWIETTFGRNINKVSGVAPYVGAWIETILQEGRLYASMSHPTWVRGLKLVAGNVELCNQVAPYVGAWIETLPTNQDSFLRSRRTLRGCVD